MWSKFVSVKISDDTKNFDYTSPKGEKKYRNESFGNYQ